MLIVASRTADEYLWAEALNLGAYDVLSKPYRPAEVVRVLSMAWLQWMNRRAPAAALAQAC
jgi:CheY-like chemotaxis protein